MLCSVRLHMHVCICSVFDITTSEALLVQSTVAVLLDMVMVIEEGTVFIWYHNWQHVAVPAT